MNITEKENVILDKIEDIKKFRKNIMTFEEQMLSLPNSYQGQEECDKINPLQHSFVDGLYQRKIFTPKGQVFTTGIHKKEHVFFLMKGDLSILSEDGIQRIKAPFNGITKPGTKRVVYVHEDTIWITVHATDKKTVEEAIEDIIAKDFDDPLVSINNMRKHLKIKKL